MKRITQEPYTTAVGFVLIGVAMIGLYLELDATVCGTIATAGIGLVVSKDNWFKP